MELITDLYKFLQVVGFVATKFPTEVWWRGQPNASAHLYPSIFRPEIFPNGWTPQKERNLTLRFLIGASTRHPRWIEGDHAHSLAMMRHYGLATRLLDWTYSPLFALFFAVREARSGDAALWFLCPGQLNQIEFGRSQILSPYVDESVKDLFEIPFHDVLIPTRKTAAVALREVDIRMSVQLGVFTVHGDPTPLDSRPDANQFLCKMLIPESATSDIRDQLFALGIRQSNLFPDLDNLATELNRDARRQDIETNSGK